MKAMIMAAGLGTRLKPWTLEHPKALVPVVGVPALQRLIEKLRGEGFGHIVVNVHHFAGQVKEFLDARDWGVCVDVSDESDRLLDTGGALAKASGLLTMDNEPVLVHNVDIISNARLADIVEHHRASKNDITLVTSGRESSRKLLFDSEGNLCGWHHLGTGHYKPNGFCPGPDDIEEAFSGIYVVGSKALRDMVRYRDSIGDDQFPVMDYLLTLPDGIRIGRCNVSDLRLLDIGKPEALAKASEFL